jgi:hypothetical protein
MSGLSPTTTRIAILKIPGPEHSDVDNQREQPDCAFMGSGTKQAGFGDASELRNAAAKLDIFAVELVAFYAKASEIDFLVGKAWWTGLELHFPAAEALAAGLETEVLPDADSDTAHQRTPREPPDDLQLAIELSIGLRRLILADKESVRT